MLDVLGSVHIHFKFARYFLESQVRGQSIHAQVSPGSNQECEGAISRAWVEISENIQTPQTLLSRGCFPRWAPPDLETRSGQFTDERLNTVGHVSLFLRIHD